MSVSKTVALLRELALVFPRPECDWEDRPRFAPPATPQNIAELERATGFVLPDELREFLEQTESIIAMSVHNGYWLGGIKQLLGADGVPRVANGETAIPVATDGGGNMFLITGKGKISRWNHETGEIKQVAATFGVFVERVAEDWAAYINGQPDWCFLV
jgi:hypothetical protein